MSTSSFAIAKNFHLPRVLVGFSGGGAEEGGELIKRQAVAYDNAINQRVGRIASAPAMLWRYSWLRLSRLEKSGEEVMARTHHPNGRKARASYAKPGKKSRPRSGIYMSGLWSDEHALLVGRIATYWVIVEDQMIEILRDLLGGGE